MSLARAVAGWWARRATSTQDRLVGLGLAAPSSVVLGIAAALEPATAGVGTHMQLGLNGCSVLMSTGWPCPMCGMTTTFAHMADASPLDAVRTQPFGVVLFMLTVAAASLGWSELVLPAGRWRGVRDRALAGELPIAVAVLVAMALGWAYKAAVIRGVLAV